MSNENSAAHAATIPGSLEAPLPPGADEKNWLVSEAEHDQGFKEMEVEMRSGARKTVKILAAPTRKLRGVHAAMENGADVVTFCRCRCRTCRRNFSTASRWRACGVSRTLL